MARMKRSEKQSMFLTAASVLDHLADEVRTERAHRKLSLRAAAGEIGMAWTTLHHVENGEHTPRADIAAKLLRWLALPG